MEWCQCSVLFIAVFTTYKCASLLPTIVNIHETASWIIFRELLSFPRCPKYTTKRFKKIIPKETDAAIVQKRQVRTQASSIQTSQVTLWHLRSPHLSTPEHTTPYDKLQVTDGSLPSPSQQDINPCTSPPTSPTPLTSPSVHYEAAAAVSF